MDEHPLPLDVARALMDRYGSSALDVARNRVNAAQQGGDMKAHDHALMVLTEVEQLVLEMDAGNGFVGLTLADQPTKGMSDHRLV